MRYLGLRNLPFPKQKRFTHETVRQIKAILNDDLRYTKSELAFMERVIKNLDYMIAHALSCGSDASYMQAQQRQVIQTYEIYNKLPLRRQGGKKG